MKYCIYFTFLAVTLFHGRLNAHDKDAMLSVVFTNSYHICNGASATLTPAVSGGLQPYTYLWSNGGTTSAITVSPSFSGNFPNASTQYSVTVTDATGQTAMRSTNVIVYNPNFDAKIFNGGYPSELTYCKGTSFQLLFITPNGGAGVAPVKWSWSNGDTTQSSTQLADSSRQILVTMTTGCGYFDTDTLMLHVVDTVPTETMTISGPPVTQAGAIESYSVTPIPSAVEYRWTSPFATTINGHTGYHQSTATAINVGFGGSSGNVCVQGGNVCGLGVEVCKPVTVLPLTNQAVKYCPPLAYGSDNCEPCVICDLNGFISSSIPYTSSGSYPNCDTLLSIENDQWIGFVPNVSEFVLTIRNDTCDTNNTLGGLQMAVYEFCSSGPINCNIGCDTCNNTPLSMTLSDLEIGKPYILRIDGWAGAQCEFHIETEPANATKITLQMNQNMLAPDSVCNFTSTVVSIPKVVGATEYIWEGTGIFINGSAPPITMSSLDGNAVMVDFDNNANYQICVTAKNDCSTSQTLCKDIFQKILQPNILPNITVCYEDAPYILPWGDEAPITGLYTTTLTTALGCDSTLRQYVTVRPPVVANITQTSILSCNSPATLIASPGSGLFTWTKDGQQVGQGSSLSVNTPGTYVLSVTQQFGTTSCSAYDTIVIDPPPGLPDITVPQATMLPCQGNPPYAALQATSNTPGATLQWVGYQQGGLISAYLPGTYTCVVTSVSGCTNSASVVVAPAIYPTVQLSADTLTCNTPNALVSATSSLPNGIFAWSNGQSGTSITVPTAGTYWVTVTDGQSACSVTGSIVVAGSTALPTCIALGDTITCSHSIGQISAQSDSNVGFLWTGPNGVTSTQATTLVITPGTYQVIVTNQYQCTNTATVQVVENQEMPDVEALGDSISCNQLMAQLTVVTNLQNATYAWSMNGAVVSTQQNPTVTEPGIYTVIITNLDNGCTAITTAEVVGDMNVPQFQLSADTLTCNAPIATLIATLASTDLVGKWTGPGGFTSNNLSLTTPVAGVYQFTATNTTTGCTNTRPVTVVSLIPTNQLVANTDEVVATKDTILFLDCLANDSISSINQLNLQIIQSDSGALWEIQNELIRIELDSNSSGVYIAQYQICDEACPVNCDTATINIRVINSVVPVNGATLVISPNDDGKNEAIIFSEVFTYPDNSLVVVNRWGQQVYYAKPYQNDWRGTYKGKPLPEGTYYFVFNRTAEDEGIYGSIMILR